MATSKRDPWFSDLLKERPLCERCGRLQTDHYAGVESCVPYDRVARYMADGLVVCDDVVFGPALARAWRVFGRPFVPLDLSALDAARGCPKRAIERDLLLDVVSDEALVERRLERSYHLAGPTGTALFSAETRAWRACFETLLMAADLARRVERPGTPFGFAYNDARTAYNARLADWLARLPYRPLFRPLDWRNMELIAERDPLPTVYMRPWEGTSGTRSGGCGSSDAIRATTTSSSRSILWARPRVASAAGGTLPLRTCRTGARTWGSTTTRPTVERSPAPST